MFMLLINRENPFDLKRNEKDDCNDIFYLNQIKSNLI